jgi:hypothetical protein
LFKSEDGAKKHALRETRSAIVQMRGYILQETNNFRWASNLTASEVISEYYRLGGTNKEIVARLKSQPTTNNRWATLAGIKDE